MNCHWNYKKLLVTKFPPDHRELSQQWEVTGLNAIQHRKQPQGPKDECDITLVTLGQMREMKYRGESWKSVLNTKILYDMSVCTYQTGNIALDEVILEQLDCEHGLQMTQSPESQALL